MQNKTLWVIGCLVQMATVSVAQTPPPNPFRPPQSTAQYGRDRSYDLLHVVLRLSINYDKKQATGSVTHSLTPLNDGLSKFVFDVTGPINVTDCDVSGKSAKFAIDKGKLTVDSPLGPISRGKVVHVSINYSVGVPKQGRPALNGTYGFHWVDTNKFEPNRKPGFWTQGETEGNRDWVPIYDYPNDKTTSETYTEVPDNWYVIGNGKLMGVTANRQTHRQTFHWKMSQPHATYLLSLVGGEMDVETDRWEDVDLYYAVPKGEGKYISSSFGDTKDMLSFFSSRFGVKYPWPKYAQTAMFDFGGGMENVSATTLGEGSLTDARSGFRQMSSLNSHELAHQWFGDLITTRDWSNIWLNEGFATFCQHLYFEHSQGADAYDRERDGALQAYLGESRRYLRPIVARYFPGPDSMFDSHTYPKGGLVLHMMRREIGDEPFFRGLKHYLQKHGFRPVDTNDLIRSFEEETGHNFDQFAEQWIYKQGHPVIGYAWKHEADLKEIIVDVRQEQDTKDGTPIYALSLPWAVVSNGVVKRGVGTFDQVKQQWRIPFTGDVQAFILDPGHDLLVERAGRSDWKSGEREAIAKYAPNSVDRQAAMLAMLGNDHSSDNVDWVAANVGKDPSPRLIETVLARLGALHEGTSWKPLNELLKHADYRVRTAAAGALSSFPNLSEDVWANIKGLITDREMWPVIATAVAALGTHNPDSQVEWFRKAFNMESRHNITQLAAMRALKKCRSNDALSLAELGSRTSQPRPVRNEAIVALGSGFTSVNKATQVLIALLSDEDNQMVIATANALGTRGDTSAISALVAVSKSNKDAAVQKAAKDAADKLQAIGK